MVSVAVAKGVQKPSLLVVTERAHSCVASSAACKARPPPLSHFLCLRPTRLGQGCGSEQWAITGDPGLCLRQSLPSLAPVSQRGCRTQETSGNMRGWESGAVCEPQGQRWCHLAPELITSIPVVFPLSPAPLSPAPPSPPKSPPCISSTNRPKSLLLSL